jgi:hypothetical protein
VVLIWTSGGPGIHDKVGSAGKDDWAVGLAGMGAVVTGCGAVFPERSLDGLGLARALPSAAVALVEAHPW